MKSPEWGPTDAVIATSHTYRTVLRQAVREALQITARDAIGAAPAAVGTTGGVDSSEIPDNYRYRFAFITESLGSYVISDALESLITPTSMPSASGGDSEAYAQQMRAAKFAICGATQVHMLANQPALLRPSELSVSPAEFVGGGTAVAGQSSGQTSSTTSHFFRGCEGSAWKSSHP